MQAFYSKCHYTKCHYAECRRASLRGGWHGMTLSITINNVMKLNMSIKKRHSKWWNITLKLIVVTVICGLFTHMS